LLHMHMHRQYTQLVHPSISHMSHISHLSHMSHLSNMSHMSHIHEQTLTRQKAHTVLCILQCRVQPAAAAAAAIAASILPLSASVDDNVVILRSFGSATVVICGSSSSISSSASSAHAVEPVNLLQGRTAVDGALGKWTVRARRERVRDKGRRRGGEEGRREGEEGVRSAIGNPYHPRTRAHTQARGALTCLRSM